MIILCLSLYRAVCLQARGPGTPGSTYPGLPGLPASIQHMQSARGAAQQGGYVGRNGVRRH